jgi:hypothetical protein
LHFILEWRDALGDVIIRTDGATFSESPFTGQNATSAVNDLWPLPTENFVAGALQGFTGRATCSPATAGAAKAGADQASPGRRHDISINSISAAPAQ